METMPAGSPNRSTPDKSHADQDVIAAELSDGYDKPIGEARDDEVAELSGLTEEALHELTEHTSGDRLLRIAREATPEITHPDIRDRVYIALAESYGARGNIAFAKDMITAIESPRRKIQGLAMLAAVTGFDSFALEAMRIPEQTKEYMNRERVDLLAEVHAQLADNEVVADALQHDREKATVGKLKIAMTARPHDNLSQLTTIAIMSGRQDDIDRATEAIAARTVSYGRFPIAQAAMVYRSYYDAEGPEAAKAFLDKMRGTVGEYRVPQPDEMDEQITVDRAEKHYANQDGAVAELLASAREGGTQVMDSFFAAIEPKPSSDILEPDRYNINQRRNGDLYVYAVVSAQLARDELERVV
jgi:hypothetical protein